MLFSRAIILWARVNSARRLFPVVSLYHGRRQSIRLAGPGRLFRKLYDLYPMPKYVCLKCSLFIEIISPPMTCDDCAARANFWRYTAILRAGHNNYPLSTFSVSTQIQPRQCVLRRDKPTIAKHDCLSAVTGKTHSI